MTDDEIDTTLVEELLRWQRGQGPRPDVPADRQELLVLLGALVDSAEVSQPPLEEDRVAIRLGLAEPLLDPILLSLHELAERLGGELDVEEVSPVGADGNGGGPWRIRAVVRSLAESVPVVAVDGDDLGAFLGPVGPLFARRPATTAVALVSGRTHLAVVVTEADSVAAIDPLTGWADPALPRDPEPLAIALGRHLERTRPRWDEIAHLDDMLVFAPDPADMVTTVGRVMAEHLSRPVRIPARRTALASLGHLTAESVVAVIDDVRTGRLAGDALLDRIRADAGVGGLVITRVRLSGWRAYERLDLDLTAPVLFVVAPNGVGKTSLVEAVRWALLGTAPGAGRGTVVRLGADAATVEVTLDVAGSTVEVRRTLTASGRTEFTGRRDGDNLSEAAFDRLLADAWAAEPGLLRTLLFGEAGPHSATAFPVRDHLAEVFGIAPLLDAVTTVDDRLKVLGREIRDLRAAEAVDDETVRAAELEVERRRQEAEQAEAAVAEARAVAELARAAEQDAAAWQAHRNALAAHQQRIAALAERLSTVVEDLDGDPASVLPRLEEDARDELERTQAETAEARVQAAGAGAAFDLLDPGVAAALTDHADVCPTCLRAINDDERDHARTHHQRRRGDAEARVQAGRDAVEAAQAQLERVRGITRSLQALRVPTPPDVADPGPGAAPAARAAQDALLAATRAHGAAVARWDDTRVELDTGRRSVRERAALVAAYREQAALEIHRASLAAVTDEYLTGRIQPLADEIARRWKLLFGSEGLQFGHDGSMRVRVGDDHLDLADLSGGERVIAFFVTRLLVVASATRATTLWLDEPLEHLDPRRRAAVAATIVRAVQQGALEQIVVTTYEERLARQLAARAPDLVAVAHVRADHPHA